MSEKIKIDLVFQVCVCVNDMEATLNAWKKLVDIDDSKLKFKSTKEMFDRGFWEGHNYMGEKCVFFHKYCRFDLGGIDMEIIEPLDKTPGNPYSDFLVQTGGKGGIHHIGVKVHDRTVLTKRMDELGIPPYNDCVLGDPLPDGTRDKWCVFYDLRELLGVIIEAGSVVVGPLADDPRAGNPPDCNYK